MSKKTFTAGELADIASLLFEEASAKLVSKGDMICVAAYFQSLAFTDMVLNMFQIQDELRDATNQKPNNESH